MKTIASQSPLLTELAGVLARAYLRLAQKPPNSDVSWREEPQNPLDLRPEESVHVVDPDQPREDR